LVVLISGVKPNGAVPECGNEDLVLMPENAAPSTALPLGESRILSPTRLTRVDPSGPAHITRLLNTVLAIVHLSPEDRIKKEGQIAPVKEEPVPSAADATESGDAVKVEAGGEEHKADAEGGGAEEEEEDMDEDEVPYREEVGWKEITGFIVM
jgi:polyribonucleotide 5'-hydroxyl-kinase